GDCVRRDVLVFCFQAEDGIRDFHVTGVQTCALPILGLGLGRTRLGVLLCGAVMAAGAASVVGTVGFVGLVAPHTARALVGPGHRRLIPVAAVFGALLVVAADVVGRSVLAPREIPVGLVVALVGAPYLAWLLRRSNRAAVERQVAHDRRCGVIMGRLRRVVGWLPVLLG